MELLERETPFQINYTGLEHILLQDDGLAASSIAPEGAHLGQL